MTLSATLRILAGVVAGLALGVIAGPEHPALPAARLIGGLWLDGLKMTVIPLVFGLIVTGIGSTLRQGGAALTRRALISFVALLALSALVGLAAGSLLFAGWQLPVPLAGPAAALPALPDTGATIRALMPANPIGAAADGAIVPVVIFALIFAFALARIDAARGQAITDLLGGVVETMLVIVGWVLWLAPAGVFALAFAVAAPAGLAVGTALGWYVLVQIIVTLALAVIMLLLVAISRRVGIGGFVRAAAPAQAVAFTTQSSLASLPAMLTAARTLGLARAEADMLLPMAVALFRMAAPASIVIVSLALAQLAGITLGPLQLAIIAALAVVNTLTIAGLPNQITFFAAYAPPALAAGLPIELLPLMLAVDAIPDMAYTVTNVTADLGLAALLGQRSPQPADG